VTAKRLGLNKEETEALVKQFVGYTHEMSGPGVKPVPPYFQIITKASRFHEPKFYSETAMPMFAAMNPPAKTRVVQVNAGKHMYMEKEEEIFPEGMCHVACKLCFEAIMSGYFADYARTFNGESGEKEEKA
jgi:hypothetical protein